MGIIYVPHDDDDPKIQQPQARFSLHYITLHYITLQVQLERRKVQAERHEAILAAERQWMEMQRNVHGNGGNGGGGRGARHGNGGGSSDGPGGGGNERGGNERGGGGGGGGE